MLIEICKVLAFMVVGIGGLYGFAVLLDTYNPQIQKAINYVASRWGSPPN